MLDLRALEQALSSIEEIGQGELTFRAGEHTITLRILTPDEEVEVQKYTRDTLSQATNQEDQSAMIEFLDRFKVGVLSHAIVAVDNLDMRDAEAIETGEVLDNGVAVRIPRFQAVRKIITPWTRPLMDSIFQQYGKLLERVEATAEAAINYEPSDLDAEIDRLKARIRELEATKTQREQGNPVKQQVDAITEFDKARRDEARSALTRAARTVPEVDIDDEDVDRTLSEEETPLSPPTGAAVSATPTQPEPDPDPDPRTGQRSAGAAPPRIPPSTGERRSAVPERSSAPPVDHRPPPPPPEPEPDSFEAIQDSLTDLSDEDAIAAEAQRLAAMRAKMMREQNAAARQQSDAERIAKARQAALAQSKAVRREEAMGGPAGPRRRAPPHARRPANTENAVIETGAGDIQPVRRPPGIADDIPVASVPAQTLSGRGRLPAGAGGELSDIPMNEGATSRASLNPKFAGKLKSKKRRR